LVFKTKAKTLVFKTRPRPWLSRPRPCLSRPRRKKIFAGYFSAIEMWENNNIAVHPLKTKPIQEGKSVRERKYRCNIGMVRMSIVHQNSK